MSEKVKAIPEGFQSVTPSLTFKDSLAAISFYKKAFNAEALGIFPAPDGKSTMHAVIKIGNSILMMGDEMVTCKSAETYGGSPMSLFVYVPNVDEFFQQAVKAGAAVVMPVADMFWGDRCGNLKDPFGYTWMIATHTQELSKEEMTKGAQEFYAEMAKNGGGK